MHWIVEAAAAGTRLDAWLAARLERSRVHAKRLIEAGGVDVAPCAKSKVGAHYRLRVGQTVTLDEKILESVTEAQKIPPLKAEAIAIDVVFEDAHLVVINKPAHLVVHPAAGHATGTLVHALLHHCGDTLARRGGLQRLGIVHRLDKETSGLIVVAKTDVAHERLGAQFAARSVEKTYQALAWGRFRSESGAWAGAIARSKTDRKKMCVVPSGGRAARTEYQVRAQYAAAAWVECRPHTGRTHQIRVHLAHAGHPVVGDAVYGRARRWEGKGPAPKRQMLHAAKLAFDHPMTGKRLSLTAPLPADFIACRKALAGSGQKR